MKKWTSVPSTHHPKGPIRPHYHVVWEIDVFTPNAIEAARKARLIQKNPNSIANVFEVWSESGQHTRIDLDELDESQPAAGA